MVCIMFNDIFTPSLRKYFARACAVVPEDAPINIALIFGVSASSFAKDSYPTNAVSSVDWRRLV